MCTVFAVHKNIMLFYYVAGEGKQLRKAFGAIEHNPSQRGSKTGRGTTATPEASRGPLLYSCVFWEYVVSSIKHS